VDPKRIVPSQLANAMGLSEGALWKLAKETERCFKPRRVQQIGKKHRPIDPMHKGAKRLFRKLHGWLQRQRLFHPAAHGGVRGRSCFTSARRHLGQKYIWSRDVSECYPSITPDEMQRELKAIGFRHDTARLLASLFTVRGGVPQGSPLSCDALNLFLRRVDQLLASFCGTFGLAYSRVADDLQFSGNDKEHGSDAVRRAERELQERGLRINEKKRHAKGFQTRSQPQLVHGIQVSSRRGTAINKKQRKEAIRIAEAYRAACASIYPESLEPVAYKRQRLQGWLHYCRQAEFGPSQYLQRLLKAGDRLVRRKLRSLGISPYRNKWWTVTARRNEPKRLAAEWRRLRAALKGGSSS